MPLAGDHVERTDLVRRVEEPERKEHPLRTLGVALVGLVVGLLAGVLVQEVIARVAVSGGQFPDSTALALFLGFVTPALAIAGVVAAPIIDGRMRHR
jgi:hypothetical protein